MKEVDRMILRLNELNLITIKTDELVLEEYDLVNDLYLFYGGIPTKK